MGAAEIAKALKSGGPTGRLPTGWARWDDQSAEAGLDAYAAFGTCLAKLVGPFDFPAPPTLHQP
jgi:hypothetical protein